MAEEQSKEVSKVVGSKRNTTTIIIVVVAVLLFLSIGGWLISKYLMNKAAEEATEEIMGSITGSEVDTNQDESASFSTEDGSFSMSSNNEWPDNMPSEVPQFSLGTIDGSAKSTSGEEAGWTVSFTEVKSGAYESYRQELIDAGWKETGTVTTDSKISNMENDKYYLIFTVNESDNTGSIIVTSR